MSLFQKSVLNKYLQTLDNTEVEKAFQKFKSFYGDEQRIENIKLLKEENYQEGFLREIFVDVLDYTINPDKDYNLTTEFKNETDSKKADGAILLDSKAIGVIELKSTKTTDMESIIDQAFNYKNHQSGCKYVITSNFEKLRFYIDNATEYEEFYLFDMDSERFKIFYLLLSKEKLLNDIPAKIKKESQLHEEDISDKLYKDYTEFKYKIYRNLIKNNPQYDKLVLFKKSQKLLDRILFILFAEDSGLVPPNAISEIIKQWKTLIDLDEKKSLYSRFVKFFHHLNVGHKYSKFEVPAYNGGLFKEDEILDKVKIDDEILLDDALKLSTYDYSTEVDVNILGHIFEHSINEIEEITAELEGEERDTSKSKRKKEGVFYTPKYITKYIVENTVGELCEAKKKELQLDEIDEEILENSKTTKGKLTKKAETLFNNLKTYREYILSLKILDPACGSGAFLNQALDFLIEEHKWIDEQRSRLLKESFTIVEYEKDILEHNLYGVDINEEAVEIAKLSLWLRTAKKGRKLSDLSGNIKCGNSLIDDPEVAGDKAFKWEDEFPEIMKSGGFDVVIGNPPYTYRGSISKDEKEFFEKQYKTYEGNYDLYKFFLERNLDLISTNGLMCLITSASFVIQKTYTKTRKNILEKSLIKILAPLGPNVFADATVDTAIICVKKINRSKNHKIKIVTPTSPDLLELTEPYLISQSRFLGNRNYVFDYLISDRLNEIIIKVYNKKKTLADYFNVGVGINTGYIRDELVSGKKENSKYHPMVAGSGISRYGYPVSDEWILYDKDFVKSKGKLGRALPAQKFFDNPKLLIVRTRNLSLKRRIIATYDSDKHYNLNRLSNIIAKGKSETLFGLLALLNSALFNWLFSTKYYDYEIKPVYLRELPITGFDNEQLIDKSKLMLELNSKKEKQLEKFLSRVESHYDLQKKSIKLTEFYNHDFKTFLDELKKKKVTLSLKQQDEWEEYFNEHKEKILELQSQINQTDREIDQLVYQLYGLTEEEIKIVEESVK